MSLRIFLVLLFLSSPVMAAYWPRAVGGAVINEVDRQRRKERTVVTVVQPQVVHTYTYQVPGESLEVQTRDLMYASILLENEPRFAAALIRHLKSQGNPEWPRLYERFIDLVPDGSVDMSPIPPLVREAGMDESTWQAVEAGYYQGKQQEQMARHQAELGASRTVAQGWISRIASGGAGGSATPAEDGVDSRARQTRTDIRYVEAALDNLPKYEAHAAVLMFNLAESGVPEAETLLARHAALRPGEDISRFRKYRPADVDRARDGIAKMLEEDDAIFRELEAAEE